MPDTIGAILLQRIQAEPFNLVATIIFLFAILHTFTAPALLILSQRCVRRHVRLMEKGQADRDSISFSAGLLEFMGQPEAVFGIWSVVLSLAMILMVGWQPTVEYLGQDGRYVEPMFVVVIMTVAASRPIIKLFELLLWRITNLMGGSLRAWWLVVLSLGPLLGSFITEPAAMTICAYLLAEKFYVLPISERLKYVTIAALFVNISVGATLTNFAAPPILMVADAWHWDLSFMLRNFGWKAVLAILAINLTHLYICRRELNLLEVNFRVQQLQRHILRRFVDRDEVTNRIETVIHELNKDVGFMDSFTRLCAEIEEEIENKVMHSLSHVEIERYHVRSVLSQYFWSLRESALRKAFPGFLPEEVRPPYRDPEWDRREAWVPAWIMVVHLLFLGAIVLTASEPVLFIGIFLFYLGFAQITAPLQNRIDLKPALMVGFFLAGLVIIGGRQVWWIEVLLGNLSELQLMFGAILLTSFNDNTAVTYLCTLVPEFTPQMKYMVVAGAVTGGGLTVIANAPNPAGQSILKGFFNHGVSPIRLLAAALLPTVICALFFMLPTP